MLEFGGNITGFNIVNYFARNADNILIGRFWGAGPLGFYSKAYNLLMLPLSQITMPLTSVAVSSLSRLYGNFPRYRAYYLKALNLITLVSTPLVCFFIICSRDLILLVLGSQWTAASDIFFVLGFSALIEPIYTTQGWLHISSGRTDRYFKWGIIGSLIIVIGFILGLHFGPLGVALAYTLTIWIIFVPCMWYAGNSAGIRVKEIFSAVSKNIAAGFSTIVILLFFFGHMQFIETTWVKLIIGLFGTCLTYSMFLLILYRDLSPFRQIVEIASMFLHSSGKKT